MLPSLTCAIQTSLTILKRTSGYRPSLHDLWFGVLFIMQMVGTRMMELGKLEQTESYSRCAMTSHSDIWRECLIYILPTSAVLHANSYHSTIAPQPLCVTATSTVPDRTFHTHLTATAMRRLSITVFWVQLHQSHMQSPWVSLFFSCPRFP